ncbi:alanine racemase domain protein [Catenulispora acidiphila DSM 44928]|uniref:Alanine racemase domain protein n=1 Tax=Catenulispora acidiphila (strain DSM 44928 / JCM 14897 / NBRC 102108 / NRRL B-24433 / ID139908) TaxID=479433 RepID=C7PVD8_CATAD|nr:alanine racemase [Catenulispora acidiphila]ACU69294.1 alanine racemase domain protein [Catenulispora acidiphila DSM 44928]
MSLTLHIDAERWRAHQDEVLARHPDLVPVAKGVNGYGIGIPNLMQAASKLAAAGVEITAVGTAAEAEQAKDHYSGRLLVLTPYLIGEDVRDLPDRVIRTVASVEAVEALLGRRVVIDLMTSMRRFGLEKQDIPRLHAALESDQARVEGFSVHMPLDRVAGDYLREVSDWVDALVAAGIPVRTLFVSHLSPDEISTLAKRHQGTTVRPRIGTQLWLGDRKALQARGTVHSVQKVSKGDRFGYRQHKARGDGHLLVVSGGTAHGVGLENPKNFGRGPAGLTPRAKFAARAAMALLNRTMSPYSWQGKTLWFAEPPHMQVSVLFLPAGVAPPKVGEEIPVEVSPVMTHVDRVVFD